MVATTFDNDYEVVDVDGATVLVNDDGIKTYPFQRKKSTNDDEFKCRFKKELVILLKLLTTDENDVAELNVVDFEQQTVKNSTDSTFLQTACDIFAKRWKLKDEMSEIAFRGLLIILEHCLYSVQNQREIAFFLEALGFHTVLFWKKAVPFLFESDMQYGTNYRDSLLFSLSLYDVNVGQNRLREVFAAIPGLQSSLLAKTSKRFEEAFHGMMQRRGSYSSTNGNKETYLKNEEVFHGMTQRRGSYSSSSTNGNKETYLKTIINTESNKPSYDGSLLEEIRKRHELDNDDDVEITDVLNGETNFDLSEEKEAAFSRSNSSDDPNNGKDSPYRLRTPSMSNSISGGRKTSGSGSGSGCGSAMSEQPDAIVISGLAACHFQERVITVSNAPPVSLRKRRDSGEWVIAQGSGGLVTCCDPVMSKDTSNIWLACFGPDVPLNQIGTPNTCTTPLPSHTNSLGLPIIRPMSTEVHLSMLQDPDKDEDTLLQEVKDQMSLLGVLKNYSKDNYNLNPVVVPDNDYNTYYGGISNGLLWPAFHNLPEYIVKDYDDDKLVNDHWLAYVRVNYQFALNAVRNSRPQDFLWIHDYHLILTGLIIQSLDSNIEVGFFLHIPFQPPEEFFIKYKLVAEAILRGFLRFAKVGFQTNRDRQSFIEIIHKRFPSARVQYNDKIDKHVVTFEGFSTSLGVFPVSIKNEDFLNIVQNEQVQQEARNIRKNVIGENEGKLFFSVERFDYTKGIKEKLKALHVYFRRHPDRIGKDVFFQVAVTNRRTVETYRQYQDDCIELAKSLNEQIKCENNPGWKPLIFQMDPLSRPKVVAHYLAMDIGVVTPSKDGMNLVAKEMLICNPKASLVLSCGAGTEQQFSIAGFYNDADKCYHRVSDIFDSDSFADILYNAAMEDQCLVECHSSKLNEFLLSNDIDKWSESFLDPSWRHDVIQVSLIKSLKGFYNLMFQTRNVRRQIVQRVLKGHPIRQHFGMSLRNAQISLEQSCQPDSTLLTLTATDVCGTKVSAHYDVSHEIRQLEIDEAFLNYVQSDAYDNLEQFLQDLSKYHPDGVDEFNREIEEVIKLFTRGDHFQYFFTDRGGTLCAYACSFPSSIQGAYSGVIQATFAQRCTQYAAILTSAPLQNVGMLDVRVMPDGYYCYGASCGREWYINSSRKFKDDSICAPELELLEKLADKISDLLEKPDYVQFAWIGSGLQRHYGHITIAKQDIFKSVDENLANKWFVMICDLVNELDPKGTTLHVQDSETDIKIYLKAKLSGKIFTKGHGIRLFAQRMNLNLQEGNILLCADSETDLPMLKEVLLINPENVYTVWVTKNEELKQKVIELCEQVKNSNYVFPSSPLVLLGAMAQATIREIKVRPNYADSFDLDDAEPS